MTDLLQIRGLQAGYGKGRVLTGLDLDVPEGQSAAILGRNGVGKTTLIHTVAGVMRPTAGSVMINGEDYAGRAAYEIQRAGVGLIPQGRRIFSTLTVVENLQVSRQSSSDWTIERVFGLFPRLEERRRNRGDQLSGGEQQMLAIGRALMGGPQLLLLDEPSDGLAPKIVEHVAEIIATMRGEGLTVLLVEQNLSLALSVADVIHIIDKGRVVHSMPASDARQDQSLLERLLGVSASAST